MDRESILKNNLTSKKNELLEQRAFYQEQIRENNLDLDSVKEDGNKEELYFEISGILKRIDAEINSLNHALSRVDQGTYGICASCDGEIGIDRLKAVPSTPLCINCLSDKEKRRPHAS